jgi:histidine ammonia-lyase
MLTIDGYSLTITDVARAARGEERLFAISAESLKRVQASRKLVDDWVASGEVIYGITTGFGEFANVTIPIHQIEELQQNLIRSHSAGVGEPLAPEVVRAMLLLRANALAKGFSGVRPIVIETLLKCLEHDVLPVVPSRGSVGSSGDLAPLAHLTLALIGEGEMTIADGSGGRRTVHAADALKNVGITPITLEAKEGLALINGTQMMSAIGCLMLDKAECLAELADIAASMSFEALRATDTAFDPRVAEARPHKGLREVAHNMLRLTSDSEIRVSHLEGDTRVQDAYSIRCIPQVHGAVRDTIRFAEEILTTEINSATDNPLIFPTEQGGEHIEGGNFHGEPLALVLDYLGIALSELANISERRTERLVNGSLSFGLPRFLTPRGGLNSGLMIAQYTAASLVSENKVLAHPASVDSIPTSANQEDHNSMGSVAALKLQQIVANVEMVLAIEMLCAAQGIDFLAPLKPGWGSGKAYKEIRSVVPFLEEDRNISIDIRKVHELVTSPEFVNSFMAL